MPSIGQLERLGADTDRRYSLEQVAEAHRYVESGQKMRNVVLTVEHKNEA